MIMITKEIKDFFNTDQNSIEEIRFYINSIESKRGKNIFQIKRLEKNKRETSYNDFKKWFLLNGFDPSIEKSSLLINRIRRCLKIKETN